MVLSGELSERLFDVILRRLFINAQYFVVVFYRCSHFFTSPDSYNNTLVESCQDAGSRSVCFYYGTIIQMPVVTIKAEIPAYGGRSIGKLNGKIVMIKGAIPGEMAEVILEEEKKDYSLGTAVSIHNPSPDRCMPECGYFGLCGGCQLQYIACSRQVQLKAEIELSPSIVSAGPWNYRLRGQFKIARGRVGFYREKSREVVDIKACPLMSEEVNQYLARARSLLVNMTVGEMHISFGGGAVALLKTSHPDDMDYKKLSRDFLDSGFSGIIVQMPRRKAIRLGMQYLTLDLENLNYTVSPLSFFQSNWSLNQA